MNPGNDANQANKSYFSKGLFFFFQERRLLNKTQIYHKRNRFVCIRNGSLGLDGKHDSFYEHALHYGAVSDMHIHTSNLLLSMLLVGEAFGNTYKQKQKSKGST